MADSRSLDHAAEFFELFKTPWEPARRGRSYAALIAGPGAPVDGFDAPVLLSYGAATHGTDGSRARGDGAIDVEWQGETFPVYGDVGVLDGDGTGVLTAGGRSVASRDVAGGRTVWRFGYDLFAEVGHLLTTGQPAAYAHVPTLELHIAVLRDALRQSGVCFVEIPPRPAGYDFTCCLTHDLDFFGIRRHGLDRTLAGFLARAGAGGVLDLVRGRRSPADVIRNWRALCSLPLVHAGLARDFWSPVEDYLAEDGDRPSTFFVIPFRQRPGVGPDGTVHAGRAVAYQASEVRADLDRAAARGHEVAVHGIDAWRDEGSGRAELAQIDPAGAGHAAGVRMHWLYFSDQSPRVLEAAGFDYDSTWGFNETVGFRAGTSQAFRLPGTRALLELPLAIMDTALFFRDRMHLTGRQALQACGRIVTQVRRFGGTLVVNWHDRSLAPERLWGRSYRALLAEVGSGNRVWFSTAGQAVAWFRWRRSIAFETDAAGRLRVTAGAREAGLPSALMQWNRPGDDGRMTVDEVTFSGPEPVRVGA